MADTIVNTPASGDNTAGWAVAVIVLLAVIGIGAYLLFFQRDSTQAPSSPASANINVMLPNPAAGGSSTSQSGPTNQ